jgi:hypothetical protein
MYNFLHQQSFDKSNLSQYMKINTSERNLGMGPFFTLYLIFKLLDQRLISLDDLVRITETVVKEKGEGIINYEIGDKVNLLQVLQNFKVTSGTDSLFLLTNHIFEKTKKRVSVYFREIIRDLNLSENVAINLSGKKNSSYFQNFNIYDVLDIANLFKDINLYYLNILSISKISFKGRNYQSKTFLLDCNKVNFFFSFLDVFIYWIITKNGFDVIIIEGGLNNFQRDSVVERIIYGKYSDKKLEKRFINKDKVIINIIGDTYLGEYYSEKRLRRNMFDPLLEKGYDYSFEKIKYFLGCADLNIVNHEACLINDSIKSPLYGLKKFILGAKDFETILALKKANINIVSMANNHTADYGKEGIENTMNILKKNNIQFLGMGMNEYEACRPLKFEINAKNISIYSGYWYRSTNQKIFKFYATPTQPGVAVLESMLIEAINLERQKYPNNFIIVIAHWGNDFLPVTSYQKNISKLLVENGANLIVGHGAHTIQSIEKFKQVPVLYSIGNGVFNSDGEFDSYPDALPYGMIAQLDIGKEIVLRIFPIKANNRDTIWQPDFVNDSEFKIIYDFYNNIKFDLVNNLEWPYYFEIKLEKEN